MTYARGLKFSKKVTIFGNFLWFSFPDSLSTISSWKSSLRPGFQKHNLDSRTTRIYKDSQSHVTQQVYKICPLSAFKNNNNMINNTIHISHSYFEPRNWPTNPDSYSNHQSNTTNLLQLYLSSYDYVM